MTSTEEKQERILALLRSKTPAGITVDLSPLLISDKRGTYATALTARMSRRDSDSISISSEVLDRAIKASSGKYEGALLFGWVDEDGKTGIVALTVEQHHHLAKIDGDIFKIGKHSDGEVHYRLVRQRIGTVGMYHYVDLVRVGLILFAITDEADENWNALNISESSQNA